MKFIAVLAAAIMLAACAGNPRDDWARQQSVYNELLDTAVELRRPCVEQGEDSPNCVIKADAYKKVEHFRVAADGYLKAADAQIDLEDDDEARRYLRSAWGALAALAANLGIAPPEEE